MSSGKDHPSAYPLCRSFVPGYAWDEIALAFERSAPIDVFSEWLSSHASARDIPPFLPALAKLERSVRETERAPPDIPAHVERYALNPTLALLEHEWELARLFEQPGAKPEWPARGHEWALVWREARGGQVRVRAASEESLLAIKVLAEGLSPEDAAAQSGAQACTIDGALRAAANEGIVLAPRSKLRRDAARLPDSTPEASLEARVFTLQWHITNACDLSCKHCYDRTKRSSLTLAQGRHILADLGSFCRTRNVRGCVCFSGGNPFLHPDFAALYRAAAEAGFMTSVLGNPVPREDLARIVDIQKPGYFQVSLEGLPAHNDAIRGHGTFQRAIDFLGVLRAFGISTAVMLTLTRENVAQVIPLAEGLRDHADHFTFNRLSCTGEGANLALPDREQFVEFLRAYVDAARTNPIMGFKDNLINVVLHERGEELFDGCTGFGCGAAFNFVALLPDGEVHACRKFPSKIGNILEEDLTAIYDGELAAGYRRGPAACEGCALRAVCGGCLAAASGQGLDIFRDRDPFCFFRA